MNVAIATYAEELGMLFTGAGPNGITMLVSRKSRTDAEIDEAVRRLKVLYIMNFLVQGVIIDIKFQYKIVSDDDYATLVSNLVKPLRT